MRVFFCVCCEGFVLDTIFKLAEKNMFKLKCDFAPSAYVYKYIHMFCNIELPSKSLMLFRFRLV